MAQYVTPDQIPASLRVKLKNPSTENIDAMISSYQGQQGVETVSDQRTILQPLFKLFNGLTVSATTVAIVMVGPGADADREHGPAVGVQPKA